MAHGARRLGNLLATVEWNIGGGASEVALVYSQSSGRECSRQDV